MTPEVAKLAYRAVIDYLGGNAEEYKRLTRLAMQHNEEMTCEYCGGVQLPCRVGQKGSWKHGYICMDCGQVTVNGTFYRNCNVPLRRAAYGK